MLLRHLRRESGPDGGQRVVMDVAWEDSDRPETTVFVGTDAEHATWLRADGGALLTGCLPTAAWFGERRVRVDAPVCPTLLQGLRQASRLQHRWFPEQMGVPQIEAAGLRPARGPAMPRSAGFLSGGVDSLHMFEQNRRATRDGSPRRFSVALFAHGLDIGGIAHLGPDRSLYEGYLERLRAWCRRRDVHVVAVSTNLRHLGEEALAMWPRVQFAATLAALGHAVSGHVSSVSVAASFVRSAQKPWGSHPLLEPLLGSAALQVRHEGIGFSRFHKVRELARVPDALEILRVCLYQNLPNGRFNCGRCIKCIKAMGMLDALDVLQQTPAFRETPLTSEAILAAPPRSDHAVRWTREIIAQHERTGRHEAARPWHEAIANYALWNRYRDATDATGWRRALRSLDDRIAGGRVRRAVHARRQRVADRS